MRYSIALACAMMGSPLAAQDLKVVTDFQVTHSLVSMVMGDDTAATLLLDQGGDPHSFQLRPSQAQALADADLVFWVGEELTPWMARALSGTETQADIVTLIEADGLHLQDFAHGHSQSHDDHGHAHDDDHGHAHDDDHGHSHDDHGHAHDDDHGHSHDDHGHAHDDDHDHSHDDHGHSHDDDHGHSHDDHSHAHDDDHGHSHDDHGHSHDDDHGHSHDDHGHSHDHGHDHSHDGLDPHAWMYTHNAKAWLDVIAAELSRHDPDNAETYAANAEAARDTIAEMRAEVEAILEPVGDTPIVMFHDAYGYLSHQFGVNVAGTIALGDAASPGAQRLSELRAELQEGGIVCIFPEVNHSSRYVDVVVEGTDVRVGATLDPEGVMFDSGADLYPTLMRSIAQEIADCVAG